MSKTKVGLELMAGPGTGVLSEGLGPQWLSAATVGHVGDFSLASPGCVTAKSQDAEEENSKTTPASCTSENGEGLTSISAHPHQ